MIGWLKTAVTSAIARLTARAAPVVDAWAAEVVRRVESVVDTGRYGLGCGGRDPRAPSPLGEYQPRKGEPAAVTALRRALGLVWGDCSALVAWAWGEPRKDSADGEDEIAGDWLYTDAFVRDALGPQRFARRVPIADVQPGDALVYGAGSKVGHCAIVVARKAVVRRFADLTVIHCHGPQGAGPAITRATGALWDRHDDAIAIRRVR